MPETVPHQVDGFTLAWDYPQTYREGARSFTLRVRRVLPHYYATRPIAFDYELFVDVEIASSQCDQAEAERKVDVPLGSVLNDIPRQLIPFGTEYFDAVKEVVENAVRENTVQENVCKAIKKIFHEKNAQ